MATEEISQLRFFSTERASNSLPGIVINNMVRRGQPLPTRLICQQAICLLEVTSGTEKHTCTHTHTHSFPKYPSHHQPLCCLAWNSCSCSHSLGSLSSCEHSVSRGSCQELDIHMGDRLCKGEACRLVAGTHASEIMWGSELNCLGTLVTSLCLSFSLCKTDHENI